MNERTGKVVIRKREFPDAIRCILELPPDCDDATVLSELAIVMLCATKWGAHVQEQDALDQIEDFYR